jgi:hypothetical protein
MRISPSVFIVAGAGICAAIGTAAAFTVGVQTGRVVGSTQGQQQEHSSSRNRLGGTSLRMDTDEFAKSEIYANDVSGDEVSRLRLQDCTYTNKVRFS